MLCLFVVLTLPPLAWISGPVVWGWLSDSLSRKTAVWASLVVCLLGFWAPARSFLKSLLKNRIVPLALLCLAVGGISNWLQSMDFFVQASLIVLCMVVTGVVCFYPEASRKTEKLYPKPAPEQLRRYPLIRGLMRAVMAGKSEREECRTPAEWRINRIAVTGPWGSGKSLILDHVAYALEHHNKARAVKVNPWACSTVDQARACLADGLRELLRDSTASSPPLFRTIAKALGYSDAIDAVFEYAAENRGSSLAELDDKLRNEEVKAGRRMILVIDDMERSEPQVVRGLLPLLNELVELRWCTFLIAIDLDHFGQAFVTEHACSNPKPEKQAATPSSKLDHEWHRIAAEGFLKKVIDFEIKMPLEAPSDRIRAMARMKLGIETAADQIGQPHLVACPDYASFDLAKLPSCLIQLETHLPPNPRDLERFLDKARLLELCFLGDYGQNEADWSLFFHLWLMETRFPGFVCSFDPMIGGVGFPHGLKEEVDIHEIVKNLTEKGVSKCLGSEFRNALQGFVNAHDFLFAKWDWYSEGFLCPPSLPGKLRTQMIKTWYSNPSLSLESLARESFRGEESPELNGMTADLLNFWISALQEALGKIASSQGDCDALANDVSKHFESIFVSFENWSRNPPDLSLLRPILTPRYFGDLANLSCFTMPEDLSAKVTDYCEKLGLKLVECMDAKGCDEILREWEFSHDSSSKNPSHDIRIRIQQLCLEKIRTEVWDSLRSGVDHPLYGNCGDALMEHSRIFPAGSIQREELLTKLAEPSLFLLNGLKYVWTKIYRWLPRWHPENGREDFKLDPEFWLVLWQVWAKGVRPESRRELKKQILTTPNLPQGLHFVRDHLLGEQD